MEEFILKIFYTLANSYNPLDLSIDDGDYVIEFDLNSKYYCFRLNNNELYLMISTRKVRFRKTIVLNDLDLHRINIKFIEMQKKYYELVMSECVVPIPEENALMGDCLSDDER